MIKITYTVLLMIKNQYTRTNTNQIPHYITLSQLQEALITTLSIPTLT